MTARTTTALLDSPAFRFVLTMGIVNLFSDTTYEGGGSINGPFLGGLGASAAAIAIGTVCAATSPCSNPEQATDCIPRSY